MYNATQSHLWSYEPKPKVGGPLHSWTCVPRDRAQKGSRLDISPSPCWPPSFLRNDVMCSNLGFLNCPLVRPHCRCFLVLNSLCYSRLLQLNSEGWAICFSREYPSATYYLLTTYLLTYLYLYTCLYLYAYLYPYTYQCLCFSSS